LKQIYQSQDKLDIPNFVFMLAREVMAIMSDMFPAAGVRAWSS
jgi:hypothetical protein